MLLVRQFDPSQFRGFGIVPCVQVIDVIAFGHMTRAIDEFVGDILHALKLFGRHDIFN